MKSLLSKISVLILLLSVPASGTIINVPGDYAVIQDAINAAGDNDTVLVDDGTYTENIDFSGKAILLTSKNGPENTVIEIQTGNTPVVTFANGEGPGSILSGFTIDGDSSYWGIHADSASPLIYNNIVKNHEIGIRVDYGSPVIRKNEITLCSHSYLSPRNGGGIRMEYSSGAVIDTNSIHHCYADVAAGIFLKDCSDIVVEKNLIYSDSSVYIGGLEVVLSDSVRVISNTLADNYSTGPILGSINVSYSADVELYNNICAFNYEYGIRNHNSSSSMTVDYNDVYSNYPDNYYGNMVIGPGSISQDPLFINLPGGRLNLAIGSPCINTGDPTLPLDPDGTAPDMGALYTEPGFGSIAGIVRDRYDVPIESVYVSIPSTAYEDWTDEFGYYQIDDLPSPTFYDVNYFHPAYPDSDFTGVGVANNDTVYYDMLLINRITIHVPGDYPTIQSAIDAADSYGDTILVADGIYQENIDFLGKVIVLISENGPENTTIQIQTSGISVVSFSSGETRNSVISGFTIDGDLSYWGIYINGASPFIYNNVIKECEVGIWATDCGALIRKNEVKYCVHDGHPRNGGGIRITESGDCVVDSNKIHHNTADVAAGIYTYDCVNMIYERNIVYFNSSVYIGGLEIAQCDSILVYNNTFSGNSSTGPILGSINVSNSSNVTISSNISAFNNEYGICNYQDNVNLVNRYNNVYGNTPANYYNLSPGTGSLSLDPLFIDMPNGRFNLVLGSPCIDAGDPSRPLDPDSTINDMGALYTETGLGQIAGVVTDRFGVPLQSVHVEITGPGYETWTDEYGYYLLDSLLSPYVYDVVFSHTGYPDTTFANAGVANAETTIIDMIMININTIRVPADYSTIQEAIENVLCPTDTVLVADGIYTENIDFLGKHFLLLSENGPEYTTIQIQTTEVPVVTFSGGETHNSILSGFTIDGDSMHWGIYGYEASPVIYNNIIKNHEIGIKVDYGAPLIRKNEITHCHYSAIVGARGGAIQLMYPDSAIIDSNLIHHNYADVAAGIYLANGSNTLVERNQIYANSSGYIGGLEISYCSDIQVYNNTFSGNTSGSISLGSINFSESDHLWIINNICAFNNEYGICNYQNNTDLYISYNDVFGNSPGDYYNLTPGTGSIAEDPLFIDPQNHDYHLALNSPCIDAGDPYFPDDPDSTVADMGALYCNATPGAGFMEGTVADRYGTPIESVLVDIGDFGLQQWTDEYGYYAFDSLVAPNGYNILFSHPDFPDSLIENVLVTDGDTSIVDVVLIMQTTIHVPADIPTIQGAIDTVMSIYDTVLVADGIYTENIDFLGKAFLLKSENGPENTTIRINTSGVPVVTIDKGEGPNSILSGFTIEGDSSNYGILISNSSPYIYNNIVKNHQFGIRAASCNSIIRRNEIMYCNSVPAVPNFGCAINLTGSVNAVIDSNIIHHNKSGLGTAMRLFSCDSLLVQRNIIYNNWAHRAAGIAMELCYNSGIYNNTFVSNSSYTPTKGNLTCLSTQNITASNNIFAFNNEYAIYNEYANVNFVTSYNDVFGNSPGDYYNCSPGVGSISLDPLFIDRDNHDFRIALDSPCINAGDPGLPYDPDGTTSDIGAFYYNLEPGFGYITGIVTDRYGVPVESVLVSIIDSSIEEWTDEFGYYLFDSLTSPGIYGVSFSHPDYPDTQSLNIFVTNDDTSYVDMVLTHPATLYVPGSYPSIQFAINSVMTDDDTVMVADGLYVENIDFLGKPVLVTSENGPESTTIKILTPDSPTVTFANGEGTGSILSGFTIEGDSSHWGIHVNGTSPYIYNNIITRHEVGVRIDGGGPTVRKNEITLCSHSTIAPRNGGAIRLELANGAVIDSNNIHHNYADVAGGIYCYDSDNISFVRNRICSSSSVYIGGFNLVGCQNIEIINNTFSGNGSSGPTFGSLVINNNQNVTVVNNIIAFNFEYGIYNYTNNVNLVNDYNDVYGNWPANYHDLTPGPGSISQDPVFFNPAGNDYHLGPGSPCIDAGDPSSPYDPDSTIADMGAHYYDLALIGYGAIGGIVSDSSYNPIANVLVLGLNFAAYEVTDSSGRYLIDSLASWMGYDLQFAHSAYADTQIFGVSVARDDTTILNVIMNLNGALAGTVTDASMSPIESVHVSVEGTSYDGFTDSVGGYFIEGIPPGVFDVSFSHPDYVDMVMDSVEIASGDTTDLNMILYQQGFIAGIVRDTAGSLIEGVIVSAVGQEMVDTTDMAGEYLLEGFYPDSYDISFWHADYHDTLVTGVVVSSNDTTSLDMVLIPLEQCEYVVGDFNVSGAFNILDPLYMVYYFNGFVTPSPSCECTPGHVWLVEGDVNGTCNVNGLDISHMYNYFKQYLSDVTPCPDCPPPGSPVLSSFENIKSPKAADSVNGLPPVKQPDHEKSKSPGSVLLTDEGVELWFGNLDESPIDVIPGAQVEIDVYIQTATDAYAGCFNLPLGADSQYVAGFLSDSLGELYGTITDWDLAEFLPVEYSPPNPSGWIGQSLLASIEFYQPWDGSWLHHETPTHIAKFVLQTVSDSSVIGQTVQCIGPGISSRNGVAVFGDTTATIELEVTQHFSPLRFLNPSIYVGTLEGFVTDGQQSPIEGVSVEIEGTGFSGVTNVNGYFGIEDITQGTYEVGFSHPMYCDTVLSGVSIVYDETTTVDVLMGGTGFIGGVVTDIGQNALSDVVVNVEGVGVSDTTDLNGEFLLEYICPGTYSVSFNHPDYVEHVESGVVVIEDDTADVDAVMWPQAANDVVLWYGSPDSSPISAYIGERLNIDVYIQTADSIYVGFFHICLGLEDRYFDSLLSGDEGQFYDVLPQWDDVSFLAPSGSPPNPAGWSSESALGFWDLSGPPNPPLHCLTPTRILSYVVTVPYDSSFAGDTVLCLGPGLNPANGGTIIGDTLDMPAGDFVEYFSSVIFIDPSSLGTIAGTVSDSMEYPIEGVIVTVQSAGLSDTTDSNGQYSVEHISQGIYNVSFSHPDYLPLTEGNVEVNGGQITVLDVTLYEMSSGCDYVVGDVNSSGAYDGLDITYGVNFFKGGPAPPDSCECTPGDVWYVAGDVNASCSYNGLDITYGVAYFKGGSAASPCADCPPTGVSTIATKDKDAALEIPVNRNRKVEDSDSIRDTMKK
ncbi:MAG: carboxypeptidase regulatory-like domain-containing protein [Candidatus Zixiibacteriota bacterium]|nr:MAG: carboxypeptidase regulatory-like domain-containing protein [candidate division Zixibacteria bacterium]